MNYLDIDALVVPVYVVYVEEKEEYTAQSLGCVLCISF